LILVVVSTVPVKERAALLGASVDHRKIGERRIGCAGIPFGRIVDMADFANPSIQRVVHMRELK